MNHIIYRVLSWMYHLAASNTDTILSPLQMKKWSLVRCNTLFEVVRSWGILLSLKE